MSLRSSASLSGLCFVGLALISSATAAESTAPALNWSLPFFSSEGFRTMTARGSEARAVDAHRFDVVDLNLTLFSGDAASRVETILLSPAASFLPDAKIARGDKSVRFIGDEVEATGTRWIYRHTEKKISLDGSVRVIFHAELKNLLQ
ncbi:MAG: hypothetical protein ABIZ04_01870 [Opitutus sp.]